MKIKSLFTVFAVAALAACTADDHTAIEPENVANAPVAVKQFYSNFGDGTMYVSAGNLSTRAWTRAANPVEGNAACTVNMDEAPTPDLSAMVDMTSSDYRADLSFAQGAYIPEGKELTPGSTNVCSTNIYVAGTLNLNSFWGDEKGSIIVLPGGTLNLNVATPDRVTILNYGTLNIIPNDINFNQSVILKTTGDLVVKGKLSTGKELYVGGDVICGEFNPYAGSVNHILGDLVLTNETSSIGTNATSLCVEGTFKGNTVEVNCASNIHVGCKMYAMTKFILHNCGSLNTNYIYAPETHITAGTLTLPDGGFADLGDLYIEDVSNTKIRVAGNSATINAKSLEIKEQYSLGSEWTDDKTPVVDPEFTINYQNLYVYVNDNREEVDFGGKTADGQHDIIAGGCKVTKGENYDVADPGEGCVHKAPETPDTPTPDEPTPDPATCDLTIEIPIAAIDEYYVQADDFAIHNGDKLYENIADVYADDSTESTKGHTGSNKHVVVKHGQNITVTLANLCEMYESYKGKTATLNDPESPLNGQEFPYINEETKRLTVDCWIWPSKATKDEEGNIAEILPLTAAELGVDLAALADETSDANYVIGDHQRGKLYANDNYYIEVTAYKSIQGEDNTSAIHCTFSIWPKQ